MSDITALKYQGDAIFTEAPKCTALPVTPYSLKDMFFSSFHLVSVETK
jgi:hypothetical protein